MLRDAVSRGSLQQLQDQGFLLPRNPGSLPRLGDTAAAFPFAGSTVAKLSMYPKDTDTDTHTLANTHIRLHILPQRRRCLQQHPDAVLTQTLCQATVNSQLAGQDRRSLVQMHTHTHTPPNPRPHSPESRAHAHSRIP